MTQAVRARSFTSFCAVQTQMKYNSSGAGNTAYYIGTDINGTAVLNMLDYLQPGGLNGAGTKGTYTHGSPQRGSGINLIRETNLDDNGGFLEQVWEAWGYLGYKYILGYFYPGNPYGPSSNPRSELGFIDNMISLGYCTWVEGPNEVDNFGPASNGGSYTSPTGGIATGGVTGNEAAAAMQCDAWTFFNGATVNVAFESFADQTYSSSNPIATALSSDYSKTIGDVANYGNVHGYAVGGYNFGDPSSSANGYGPMSEQITNNAGWEITAGVPVIVTETGFISGNFNSSTQSAGAYDGKYGSDYVNGCYMPQLYLHGFNYRDANGNPLGCLSCYELGDDQPDNGTDQTHYGLFFINQVPKGGAAVLNAFMQIVSDTGVDAASFSPGSLSYTLSGMPSNGESLLLQTSNGTFILCLWANASIYVNGTPTVAGPWNVTVAFGSEQSAVNIFDPNWPGLSNPTSSPPNYGSMTATAKNYNVVGSTAYAANTPQIRPIQAFTNTSSITVSLGDGAIFVVIPSVGGASFAGAGSLSAAANVPALPTTMAGAGSLSAAANVPALPTTMAGAGSLSAAANVPALPTTMAGAGSLSAAANVPPNLTIIVGTSSLATAAIESVPAVVVVTGTGAFAASGIPAWIGASASFAGAGTMSASAAVDVAVASALAAAGTLSLAPQVPIVLAATAFAGLGAFTATGPPAVLPATSFPAIGTFVGSVVQAKTYSVALLGTGSLGLSGEVAAIAAASLAGAGGLAATAGVVHGAVSLVGSGSFVAAAIVAAKTATVLSGAGGLAATATVAVESASVLLGVGKLVAASATAMEFASILSGAGSLVAAAGPARGIALAFPGTGGLAVAAGLAGEVALAFPGIGGLAVAAGPARGIALAFPGIGGLAVAAGLAGEVVSILSGIGGLAVAASPARGIALAFPGIGGLAVAAGLAGEVVSILSGIGGLAVAASPAEETVAALAGTSGLAATARVAEAAGGMFLGVGALSALALPPIAGGIVGMASVGALAAAVEANLVLAGASLAGSAMILPVPIPVVSAFPFIGIGGLVAVGLVPHLPQDVQVGFTLLPPGHPHAVGRHRFHR